jgi:hypothetical protein
MELEALCRKLREDTQRLEEEKATLEGMVESRDELLMEIARKTGLGRMGEDVEDEEEEEDADDGGDAVASPAAAPLPHAPPAAAPEEVSDEGSVEMISKQEAPVPHEFILADAEPKMPHLCLYHALMRDYEEHPLRMTLMIWMMTQMKAALTWMSGFPTMGLMIRIESSNLNLKFRFKNKFLGIS